MLDSWSSQWSMSIRGDSWWFVIERGSIRSVFVMVFEGLGIVETELLGEESGMTKVLLYSHV